MGCRSSVLTSIALARGRLQVIPETRWLIGSEAFQRRYRRGDSVAEHLRIAEVFRVVVVQPFSLCVTLADFMRPQDMTIRVIDQFQLQIELVLD